jgi:adenylate cyclase
MVRERVGDWRSAWRFGLAGLVAGLLVVATNVVMLLDGPFFAAQDRLYPAPAPDPSITLVAIDQASLNNLGGYPLFNNSQHAQAINYLASLHPKVILFDVPLDRLTADDPETGAETNHPLTAAIKAAGNVVLVCTADQAPWPEFAAAAAAIGDRGLGSPDAAGAVRGVVLRPTATCPQNESDEPAFLQALRISEGINDALVIKGDHARFGSHDIRVAGDQMLINFTKGGSPTCTYADILRGACLHPELITNHIVIVGAKLIDAGDVYTQPVSFSHDSSFCPASRPHCMLDNQNYGYRIMGDAMSTVLLDRPIRVESLTSIRLIALVLSVLVGLIVYLLSFRLAAIATGAMLVLYYVAIYALGQSEYLADPLFAPLAMILAAGASLAARYVLEERERRKVERIFGHYIDPRIARQLAASRSVTELISKGERRELTLMFVDIRGFTTMSEAMAAEDVLALIQEYLDAMSALILKWDGTIDKYVGDEIVAIWNAPVVQPNHALLAVRCAYDLIDHAAALQSKLAAKGLPPISWGIGVNSGPAVVGNMGSKDRLQYTALGDTVNTAARFCSVAPAFTLLVGQPTLDACKEYVAVEQIPGPQLKGKSAETFRVFKVVAVREEPASPWVPFPTEVAVAWYTDLRQRYAKQIVFAAAPPE